MTQENMKSTSLSNQNLFIWNKNYNVYNSHYYSE